MTSAAGEQVPAVRIGLRLGCHHILVRVPIDSSQPADQVVERLRQEYLTAIAKARPMFLPRSPFWEYIVEVGEVSLVVRTVRPRRRQCSRSKANEARVVLQMHREDPNLDHELEAGPRFDEVIFTMLEYDPVLTAVFARPHLLRGDDTSFAARYPEVVGGMKAIVVDMKINQWAMFCLVFATLVLAVVAGIIIGSTTNAQTGFACFISITAVLGVVLPFFQWIRG
jgi:hypothetical protein